MPLMNWVSATFPPQHPGSAKFWLNERELGYEGSPENTLYVLAREQTLLEIPQLGKTNVSLKS